MFRSIIVDDDELCQTVISDMISEIDNIECIATFENALDAFNFLKTESVDVIFLDVEMPKMGGMDLLRNLKVKPQIVMITSHDEFALESYEYDVTDFLKKPVSNARFLKTIEKLQLRNQQNDVTVTSKGETIFIKTDSKLIQVKLKDIIWVEALGNYMQIHTTDDKFTILSTMKDIASKLPSNGFIRIQRSFIVRLDKIKSIEDNYVVLDDKQIHIGKAYKENLNEKLNLL
ncbi:MAG: LytTR family DNA-binding domain-containing protein [Flavobacteriales bacterium]|nr:LytTR family DNA-binding domain-containing protein [Flavobacteriales bacterium]